MKQINILLLILVFSFSKVIADDQVKFLEWKKNFKILALNNNISENTFNKTMKHVKFLPNVIKYDRYQPEFYEDTKTYVSKRSSDKKVKNGIKLYNSNIKLIDKVEKNCKNLLLKILTPKFENNDKQIIISEESIISFMEFRFNCNSCL